jgi:KDO2-lipid IV(A) lauroyltransferase
MQRIIFYIFYPFIWLLSKAPFFVLYLISDFIFLILFYLVGYRKKLVLSNLKRVFPDKTESEILKIRRKFYHHFVDIFMEMIKTFTISDKQISKHYNFTNISLLNKIGKAGKSMVVVGSHYGNWEWVVSMSLHTDIDAYGTYTKINNKLLEEKIKTTRSRFGGYMVLKKDTIKNIANNYKNNKIGIYGLLSDQSPQIGRAFYWTNFLGVRVPVHTGAEMLSKRYDCAFVYMKVNKVKRGYYDVSFELISDEPKSIPDFQLTDIFLEKTEKQIKETPEYYFWTHNRFKHEGKENKN